LELAPELDAGRQLKAPTGRSFVHYLPYGVVVSIVPWNAPVTLGFLHVIPALLGGNGVVVKPPESCPLALVDSLGVIAELLPAGLLNMVTGRSSELGEVLTTHPDVAKIGFTGGIPAARRIMANAAQSIKGVTLELGGNDPAILLDDTEFGEDTIKRMAHGGRGVTRTVRMQGGNSSCRPAAFVNRRPERRGALDPRGDPIKMLVDLPSSQVATCALDSV
jgi:acyl-CoA reductase-like NAD-dependent aldehyde dehydrogenase